MSLWIYRCNNAGSTGDFNGDWASFFDAAARSRSGTTTWGGPGVTRSGSALRIASEVRLGQRMLCWQRWGRRPDYEVPKGVQAAAIGIVELARIRPRAALDNCWELRPVERFDEPVPLLAYRQTSTVIDGIFRTPLQMRTFQELSPVEEREVLRLCRAPRQPVGSWPAVAAEPKRGAGFGDPVANAKIERAAVRHVTRLLERDGWTVTSKESEKVGYDLLARRARSERHIEVKGVSGARPAFILTANEAKAAVTDPKWEVHIVTHAASAKPKVLPIPGADLSQRYTLRAISYRAEPVS